MNRNINTLILRVNDQNGIVAKYQRTLYEAAILGIEKVIFIYEDGLLFDSLNRIEYMKDKLYKTCEVLGLYPYETEFTFYCANGIDTVGFIDSLNNVCSFNIM